MHLPLWHAGLLALYGLSLLGEGLHLALLVLAVVALGAIVWGTLRSRSWCACLAAAALCASLAVRGPAPDALDLPWMLLVPPWAALHLKSRAFRTLS
jgi:hypothetical protein